MSWFIDGGAIARAELFDDKLALLINAAGAVVRYKTLADTTQGFRAPKSDIEIPPSTISCRTAFARTL